MSSLFAPLGTHSDQIATAAPRPARAAGAQSCGEGGGGGLLQVGDEPHSGVCDWTGGGSTWALPSEHPWDTLCEQGGAQACQV